MSAGAAVSQSEWLTLAMAVLNVVQVVWLADIAARARRRRRTDPRPGERRRTTDRAEDPSERPRRSG